MVRTKQTAKKSTGAPAPRKALIVGTKPPARPARVSVNSPDITNKKDTTCTVKKTPIGFAFGLQLTIKRSGVVIFTDQAFLDNREKPASHREGFEGSSEIIFLPKGASYRTTSINPSAKTILVLALYLDDRLVDAGVLLSAALKMRSWAPGRVAYCSIPFNFVEGTGVVTHAKVMEKLAAELAGGFLSGISSISLIVATHSDPHRGDFHCEGGNRGSAEFRNLMEALLPDPLRGEIRRRGTLSHFILLACGSFWYIEEPRKQIGEFLVDLQLDHLIGFAAIDLQPVLTGSFLENAMECFLIHGKRLYIRSIVPEHGRLGSHSGVVLFSRGANSSMAKTLFLWHHPTLSPFGNADALTQQCNSCGALSPWTKPVCKGSKGNHSLTVQCKWCSNVRSFVRPSGYTKITGGGDNSPYNRNTTGDWLEVNLA
ncbi:hypothetical protein AAF712_014893 [Marasmius tenuissimus]|uniref:Uncharacterized protein n=1 Tax=Marasmius tenuissimus TaxID=585030 RepID=A0ABR2ZB33_9AGAR